MEFNFSSFDIFESNINFVAWCPPTPTSNIIIRPKIMFPELDRRCFTNSTWIVYVQRHQPETHRQHSNFVCKRHFYWLNNEMANYSKNFEQYVKLSELKQKNKLLPYFNLFDFCLWNAETNLLSALRSLKRLSRAHHWINLVQILTAL